MLPHHLIVLKDPKDLGILVSQYKMVAEAINNTTQTRELSNTFWTTVNSLGISALAYIRQDQGVSFHNKPLLLWTILLLGAFLAISWIRSLRAFRRVVDINNAILIEFERYLPAKVFTTSIAMASRHSGKGSITAKEMMVPLLFLCAYIVFGALLALGCLGFSVS